MDAKYSIKYSLCAIDDIEQIHTYISTSLLAPHIADKLVAKIFNTIDSLTIMPERGRLYNTNEGLQLRSVRVAKYTTIFLVDKENALIKIYAVAHSRRNLTALLKSRQQSQE